MTDEEFLKVKRTLKASFLSPTFMAPDTLDTWFNALNEFNFCDIQEGIDRYIKHSSKTPTIYDIRELVMLARKERMQKTSAFGKATKTIKCKECGDKGFTTYWKDDVDRIVSKTDGVYEYMKPCRCERGRQGWPEDYKYWYETKRNS